MASQLEDAAHRGWNRAQNRAVYLSRRFSTKACIAEFIGTLLFVHLGTGFIVSSGILGLNLSETIVGTALAFGASYTILLYATRHLSGGQLNPAVTLGLFSSGYLPIWQALANIFAQLLGALVGSLVLRLLVSHSLPTDFGLNTLPHHAAFHTVLRALLAEVIGTFLLTLVYLETRFNPKSQAVAAFPAASGLALFLAILVFTPISTGSFNPARSFGPAVAELNFRYLWLYIVGPILGALLAVPLHALYTSDWDTLDADARGPYVYEFENVNEELLIPARVVHEGNLE